MEKDIARLRELESEATREKIAQIRTREETGLEAARIEQSKRAAQERETLEAESKRKEAELKKAREKAALREGELRSEESERAEEEKELLRAQFKEAQLKEEDKRRKFLESVEEKFEPRVIPTPPPPVPAPPQITPPPPPVPPVQAPSLITPPAPPMSLPLPAEAPAGVKEDKKPFKFTLPSFKIPIPSLKLPKIRTPKVQLPKVSLPKVPMPKVEGYFPAKPSIFAKIWIRIIISLFVLAILATIITFWYWYLAVRPQMPLPIPPAAEAVQEEKLVVTQRLLQGGYYLPASARVINSIIVHSGYSKDNPHDLEAAIQSYKTSGTAVHYLISREGAVYQLSPDYAVAFHAANANNVSIGIGLVYQESESPSDAQYQSLSRLIEDLREKYSIPTENVLGYKDIAPSKTTPWNFDWEYLKSF